MKNDKTLKEDYNYNSTTKRSDCYCDPKMEQTKELKKERTCDSKTAKAKTESDYKEPAHYEFGTESFANPFTLTNNRTNKTNR